MARDYSPPDSPLSSMGSSEPYEDDGHHDEDAVASRPSKRQKLEVGSTTSSAVVPDPEPEPDAVPEPEALEGLSDVSTDTSGDIPSSPANARLEDEDFLDQVTTCDWEGCTVGEFANMDKLVDHIHNSHIENRSRKYTCEWTTCNRKGMPHASGYALKAHMRSHTREKPFYCYLPECDRSFTRSDALAKHMRTVHETEALRPSDPVPKSQHGPAGKTSKLKIIIKTPQAHGGGGGDDDLMEGATNGEDPHLEYYTPITKEQFAPDELSLPVDKLYRKCYWEVKWAEEIGESLNKECKEWEDIYYKEWLEKEVLLSQVVQGEVDWHERRQAIISGVADVQISGAMESQDKEAATNGAAPEKVEPADIRLDGGLRPPREVPAN